MTNGQSIGVMASGMRGPLRGQSADRKAERVLRGGDVEAGQGGGKSVDRCDERNSAFVCFSVPGAPVGKQRARSRIVTTGAGKQFVSHYTPKETVSYENLIKTKAEAAMGVRPLILGAVELIITAFVVPPASWSQKKQRASLSGEIFPTSKPDIDNMLKALCDGLNGIVWQDDKQVADLRMSKRYASVPGLTVAIREVRP